jgi:hypothetical protein
VEIRSGLFLFVVAPSAAGTQNVSGLRISIVEHAVCIGNSAANSFAHGRVNPPISRAGRLSYIAAAF